MSSINHNKHNLQLNQEVDLDYGYITHSVVIIKEFTPNKMFATVYPKDDPNYTWQVMTYRLSPIDNIN